MRKAYKPSWVKIGLLALGVIAIGVGGYFLARKIWKPAPKQVYEALVMVTDQKNSDPVEDAKSSLKAGDVLVILPEGHSWSDTEKISYLILKMNLTEDQAQKLLQPEQRKRELSSRKSENRELSSQESQEMETIRARQYRLKIETLGFDLQKFWENSGQPYADKVFDEKLIEKKKNVK